jgi:hypothetical protein
MLCNFCERITIAGLKSDEGYLHAPSLKSLRSASQHCTLCALFSASTKVEHGLDKQVVLRYAGSYISISSQRTKINRSLSAFYGEVDLFVPYGHSFTKMKTSINLLVY